MQEQLSGFSYMTIVNTDTFPIPPADTCPTDICDTIPMSMNLPHKNFFHATGKHRAGGSSVITCRQGFSGVTALAMLLLKREPKKCHFEITFILNTFYHKISNIRFRKYHSKLIILTLDLTQYVNNHQKVLSCFKNTERNTYF